MPKQLYKRIITFLKRRNNAKLIGISFRGIGKFQLPGSILISKKPASLRLFKDHSTTAAFIDIFLDDCYGLQYFKNHMTGINTIVDIGANQGLFVLHARGIFPKASIAAYEPNELVLPALEHHAKIASASYYHEAVGLIHGKIVLTTKSDTLHGKTFLSDAGAIPQTSIAKCLSRVNDRVDLLKLDCEGAEWEILKDTNSFKKVRAVTLEYHLDDEHMDDHQNKHDTIIKILEANQFKIIRHKISDVYWGMVWAENTNHIK